MLIIGLENTEIDVRCPRHTIHFMRFGYEKYIERVLKLSGLKELTKLEVKKYETWTPYRL